MSQLAYRTAKYDRLIKKVGLYLHYKKRVKMYRIKEEWTKMIRLERELVELVAEDNKERLSKQREIF